ncbi:MAG: hypothetical protein SGI94_17510 [Saprospiraceae bacterium]|nr:hypothetical protein [Saprospiraceae bacterium]
MKPPALFFVLLLLSAKGWTQNCNAFLYAKDTLQYEACLLAEAREGHYQYSKAYQEALDRAIEKCPYFSYAYLHKSTAYLKSGDFLTWKQLIDKAVALNAKENLGYRAWCRYQFFRDYQGAIDDVETLDSLISYDLGYSAGGEYHLNIAKALCHKALGNKKRAVEIIENQLTTPDYTAGVYDYMHLGVLYLELGNPQRAIDCFAKQTANYELAENQFYLGLTYKSLQSNDQYLACIRKSRELYVSGKSMNDPYTEQMDKIYLQVIENELNSGK